MKKFYNTLYVLSFGYLLTLVGSYFYVILRDGVSEMNTYSIDGSILFITAMAVAIVIWKPFKSLLINTYDAIKKYINKKYMATKIKLTAKFHK